MPTPQNAGIVRVTGSWIRLLTDWLDQNGLDAPALRAAVAAYGPTDNVPINDWAQMLEAAFALRPQDQAASLAPRLYCSVRTLQRRLDEKNLSWKALLDRTREQLACQYLADNSLSLLEVSMLLGYRNQGTFSRAFRRWQNCSPLAYRKHQARLHQVRQDQAHNHASDHKD